MKKPEQQQAQAASKSEAEFTLPADGIFTTPEQIAAAFTTAIGEYNNQNSQGYQFDNSFKKYSSGAVVNNLFTYLKKSASYSKVTLAADVVPDIVDQLAANMRQSYPIEEGKPLQGSLGKEGILYVFEKLLIDAL